MVTICTASLTFSNSTFCPHSVFMCFVWISEQTAIISLYNINWLVFITQTECVYCAVRIGYLYMIQANLSLWRVTRGHSHTLSALWCLNVNKMQVGETRVTVAVSCFILLERVSFKVSVAQSISEGCVSGIQVNTVVCKSARSLA